MLGSPPERQVELPRGREKHGGNAAAKREGEGIILSLAPILPSNLLPVPPKLSQKTTDKEQPFVRGSRKEQ